MWQDTESTCMSQQLFYAPRTNIQRQDHEHIPIHNSLQENYPQINSTKEVKNLKNEDFKPLNKEIEKDSRKWKDIPHSGIGRINMRKMTVLAKAGYRFNVISIKIPISFLAEIYKITLKFIGTTKDPRELKQF